MRTPGLTLALLLTIALGIGSDVSVYGFIRGFAVPHTGMTPQVSAGISRIARLLRFAAGAVFVVACGNIVSFLLGRAFTRSHETSLRVALGARGWQLIPELLSDSIVISIAGGLCGMLLALWTSRILPAFLFEQDAERLLFAPDLFSIVIASAACVAIIIAMWPCAGAADPIRPPGYRSSARKRGSIHLNEPPSRDPGGHPNDQLLLALDLHCLPS